MDIILSKRSKYFIVIELIFTSVVNLNGLFIAIFLTRSGLQKVQLVEYSIMLYIALIVGFIVNGYLLKRFRSASILRAVFILMPLFYLSLGFIVRQIPTWYLLIGFISWFIEGLGWANCNFLVYRFTKNSNRNKFAEYCMASQTGVGVILPVLFGYIISAIPNSPFNSVISAVFNNANRSLNGYFLMFFIELLICLSSLYLFKHISVPNEVDYSIKKYIQFKKNRKYIHIYNISILLNGMTGQFTILFGSLTAFIVFKKEVNVGTFNSIFAILSILIGLLIAKKIGTSRRLTAFLIGGLLYILAYGSIAISLSLVGLLLLYALTTLAFPFINLFDPIIYEEMDKKIHNPKNIYFYILDNELFLDIGRILSAIIILLFVLILRNDAELISIGYLLSAVFCIFFILCVLIWKLNKKGS